MKKKRPPKSGGEAPAKGVLSAGNQWIPSTAATSDSTLKHLVYAPLASTAQWDSSDGGNGGGGCSVSLTVPSFVCAEGTISGTAVISGTASNTNLTVTKPDGSQVSGSSPLSFTYTPPPGSFGTSVSFTATSNECGGKTKSTKVIWVRFSTSDPWEDNKPAQLTVTANPLMATDINSVTWTAVPDAQGTAKNALGSTTLNFSQVGQDKLKWQVDVVKWFADSPDRVCFNTTAKYKVTVTGNFQEDPAVTTAV